MYMGTAKKIQTQVEAAQSHTVLQLIKENTVATQ